MAKRSAKKVITRPLRTEREYEAALDELEAYFDHEPTPGTPAADRFDLLALLVDAYETKHHPIDPPDPVDAIRFRMEAGGFSQADLGRLLGSRQRASDVLRRRRQLTVTMIWRLHRQWGIPAESLIRPPVHRGQRRRSAA